MTQIKRFNCRGVSLWLGMAVSSVVLAALSGCSRSEEPKKMLYHIPFPKDATHLELDWPVTVDHSPAVRFRIPREVLDTGRLRGDEPGQVDWVFIDVPVPEATAAKLAAIDAQTLKRPQRAATTRKRLKVVELRSIPNNARMRRQRYEQWKFNCPTCAPDGMVGGLARYSETWCPKPEHRNLPWAQERLRRKEHDDLTPDGCMLARSTAYLTNSMPSDQGENGLDIECRPSSCHVFMQVEGREVYVSLPHQHLPYAIELVDAIRAQLTTYIR